jgi:hypothetical protein
MMLVLVRSLPFAQALRRKQFDHKDRKEPKDNDGHNDIFDF